jgi:alpha-galactosidase
MTLYTLENAYIQVEVNPGLARWSVSSRSTNQPSLKNVQIRLNYRRGRTGMHLLDRWKAYSVSDPETIESPHGPLSQISLVIGPERDEIPGILTFALPQNLPLLLWKISVKNQGTHPVYIDEIELLSAGYIYPQRGGLSGQIRFPNLDYRQVDQSHRSRHRSHPTSLTFFSNGWQSWSRSGSYQLNDHYLQTRLGFLRTPMVKNAQTPNSRRAGLFASDMFGVLGDRNQRHGLLFGFLSQKEHFGSLETWLGGPSPTMRLWANGDGARLDPGEQIETDWACVQFLHLDNPDPLAPYLEAVAREHGLSRANDLKAVSPTGWCSWYQFSGEDYIGSLSADDIRDNLEALHELREQIPLEIVQIDDGFESQVGDWFSFNQGFEDGLSPLAVEIRKMDFTPGLWLAPFILHPKSRLAAQHPDWLLRNRFGLPVNAGFLWNAFTKALDLTHPDALAYVQDVVHSATGEWGFTYLKLDFLYAAALPGRYQDATRTRAQVLRSGLEAIRRAAGEETFLLGCGCPLGSAIGFMDGMRIGADTARRWKPSYKGIESLLKEEVSFPSAFNALHNALTRSDLHKRWWINDPDCLLLRPETQLTKTEVETIASVIALTGGSLMVSDHMPALPAERLRIAECLLPLIGKRPYILDWFDSSTPERVQLDLEGPSGPWHLIALFNWDDQATDLSLLLNSFYLNEGGELYAREFWSGTVQLIPGGQNATRGINLEQIPAHGVVLFALRPRHPYSPQYLGSDLHISQGLEVINWQRHDRSLICDLERPGYSNGSIEIATPRPIKSAFLNGISIPWTERSPGGNLFELEFNKTARIEIIYQ